MEAMQRTIHALAVEKGWWETHDRDYGELISLIHSELSEALEEWRNNKPLKEVYYNASNPQKPEGFPIELADAAIRILDTMAAQSFTMTWDILSSARTRPPFRVEDHENVGRVIARLHLSLSDALKGERSSAPAAAMLVPTLAILFNFAQRVNIDLENAMRMKMAYNKTRSYRHGNKVA